MYPPFLDPRFTPVVGPKRHDSVRRKVGHRAVGIALQQCQQPGQMGEVPGDQDVSRFVSQSFLHPCGRIIGLEIPCRREFGQRIRRPPENLCGLLRAQLATVPHHVRLHAAGSSGCSDLLAPFTP